MGEVEGVNWYEEYGIKSPYFADDAVCIVHGDCRLLEIKWNGI